MRSLNSSNHHDHSKERLSTETWLSTRACLGPCENRAKISPNMGCNKMPRSCDMVVVEPAKNNTSLRLARMEEPWVNLLKQHRRSTHPCLAPVVEPIRLTWA
ncbi:hypothetical protein GOBAR_AA28035 [Gossypium barbadense]|uniref:Uncharacterized protein n=1 Tax=Gossypium barbadense TaxID=3634 RepID=A0A2P5WNG7_GOSBA|nr:hypothetical protein GOBAR_AA28035 [Gossypium barbadense]